MPADLECVDEDYNSYKISYFIHYMTDFNKMFTKMIDMRPAKKLVNTLSLEMYVNVDVHKKNNS